MKILAIDYGAKKIGLAVSDKKGRIAFPFGVVNNDAGLIERLKKIIKQEEIEKIIVGAPRYNPKTELYYQIETFINNLEANFDLPIKTHDELLTSKAAQKIKSDATSKAKSDHDLAAMLILEDYLTKNQ
ncbi:MAG: Holliday junction resolvase RuvX [Patescibacteria group bacterium]